MTDPVDFWPSVGAGLMAVCAALAALGRHHIYRTGAELLGRVRGAPVGSDGQLSAALDQERINRRADVEQVRAAIAAIEDRTQALERVVTGWITDHQSSQDLLKLQQEVHNIADKLGSDLGNLRDLILELLRRAN